MTKIDQKIERLQEILRSPVISKTKTEYEDTLMLLSWLNELKEYREEYARSLGYEDEGGDKIEIDFDNGIDDDFDEEEFDDELDDILEEIEINQTYHKNHKESSKFFMFSIVFLAS